MAEGSVIACHSTEEFYEKLQLAKEAGKLVIIDFTASWCPPCRVMSPIFEGYAQQYPEAVFLKVDVDELRDIAEKYNIQAMPTFLFLKDEEVVDKMLGASKDGLHTKIKSQLLGIAAVNEEEEEEEEEDEEEDEEDDEEEEDDKK